MCSVLTLSLKAFLICSSSEACKPDMSVCKTQASSNLPRRLSSFLTPVEGVKTVSPVPNTWMILVEGSTKILSTVFLKYICWIAFINSMNLSVLVCSHCSPGSLNFHCLHCDLRTVCVAFARHCLFHLIPSSCSKPLMRSINLSNILAVELSSIVNLILEWLIDRVGCLEGDFTTGSPR